MTLPVWPKPTRLNFSNTTPVRSVGHVQKALKTLPLLPPSFVPIAMRLEDFGGACRLATSLVRRRPNVLQRILLFNLVVQKSMPRPLPWLLLLDAFPRPLKQVFLVFLHRLPVAEAYTLACVERAVRGCARVGAWGAWLRGGRVGGWVWVGGWVGGCSWQMFLKRHAHSHVLSCSRASALDPWLPVCAFVCKSRQVAGLASRSSEASGALLALMEQGNFGSQCGFDAKPQLAKEVPVSCLKGPGVRLAAVSCKLKEARKGVWRDGGSEKEGPRCCWQPGPGCRLGA